MKRSSFRKYLEFSALCLLAVAIAWWFGRGLDWSQVSAAVRQADWLQLALAVLLISAVYLFRAYRWGALLAPLGRASVSNLFAATTLGFSAVFLIGRAGEVVRPVALPLREPGIRPSASFVTILVERIYDLMAVIFLFALNLLWFEPPGGSGVEFTRVRLAGMVLLGLALTGVVGLTVYRRKSAAIIALWEKWFTPRWFMPARLNRAAVSVMSQLARALRVLVDAKELAVTITWTALVWLGIAFGNLLVIRAFGLDFGVKETFFVLGWSLVGSLVPTPGGAAGAFHAATAAGLVILGVEKETAAAIAILMHLVDFGPALIFGLYYFLRGDINISRLRRLTSTEAVEEAVERDPVTDDPVLDHKSSLVENENYAGS